MCFYVDLLCRHLSLRILVIGRFLATQAGDQGPYERFVEASRKMGRLRLSVFALEEMALDGSTVVLSILIVLAGYVQLQPVPQDAAMVKFLGWYVSFAGVTRELFILSGAGVIVLTIVVRAVFWRRNKQLQELAASWPRAKPEHKA